MSQLFLSELSLNNFATFSNQVIYFSRGLNVIIGETGSGKSLILEALEMLLGARADKKIIRQGAEHAIIEASFDVLDPKLQTWFEESGYPYSDEQVVIKRILYSNGKSKSFINYQACTLTQLADFARRYIDLVGQFENQKLLSPKYQLKLLDDFSNNAETLHQYQELFYSLQELNKKKKQLQEQSHHREQQLDFINFQINEIEDLNPSEEDERTLLASKKSLSQIEEKAQLISRISALLSTDQEESILSHLGVACSLISKNQDLLEGFPTQDVIESYEKLEAFFQELSSFDPDLIGEEDIQYVIDRLDQYQKLKRKYGKNISEILEKFQSLKEERSMLENIVQSFEKIDDEIKALTSQLNKVAKDLSQKRKGSASIIAQNLTKLVRSLNMQGASIKIKIDALSELNSTGSDFIEFMAETNPGEGFHPIKKVASGGELSRILLSLRQIISATDSISIFLFDEVDSGIGGETALKVGEALVNVAADSQVIAISHLPQIAIGADQIIKVNKEILKDRTFSKAHMFSGTDMKAEIESMVPSIQ